MRKHVTLAMIAEACNTSVGTVSRALHQKADINEETRAAILETARRMGYQIKPKLPAAATKPIRIGIVYCHENRTFYDQVTKGIQEAESELRSLNISITQLRTTHLDQEKQCELLQTIRYQDYDGLLINSAGVKTTQYIDRFVEQGIPVATFNTDNPNSKRLFFVGVNTYDSGYMGGGLIGKFIRGCGKVAVFGDFTSRSSWVERFNGFCSVIQQEFPKINIIPILHGFTNEIRAYEEVNALLNIHPDVSAIFAPNSVCTTGAIHALTEAQRRDIVMVGFDLAPSTRQALFDGYCDAVLYQNPYNQGYLAVKYLVQYITSGKVPLQNAAVFPASIILKYNMDLLIDTNSSTEGL